MADNSKGLGIQLLRGLDNSMPAALRSGWQRMTPGLQKIKADEQAAQLARAKALRQGGGDPEAANAQAELEQARRARQ